MWPIIIFVKSFQMESEFSDTKYLTQKIHDWPKNGKIEFKDFSLKYMGNHNCSLNNINLTIEQGDKVGIVGRTGSGKTSLAQSLFKLIEPYNGYLMIDNVDIRDLDISDIRSAITMFPQVCSFF